MAMAPQARAISSLTAVLKVDTELADTEPSHPLPRDRQINRERMQISC
jgi:hypothetical protein